ncbi:MAG: DsrE/DsrF/DrsH-like family protein [Chloroflexi bacterium]|nr:DsrE/DsrF/DrsH-like family protein [Chloroflexota bacterium]
MAQIKESPLVLDAQTFARLHAQAHKETEVKRIALVASKGTLDMAYPPLILATTAAAMGQEAGIFFTFYGLDILNKKKLARLQVAPLANPAMPMPVPNIIGAIPGMTAMATWMMGRMMRKQKMPTVPQFLELSKQLGVRLIACTTTMGIMGIKKEELLDGVEIQGAAAFLEYAAQAQVTLFI